MEINLLSYDAILRVLLIGIQAGLAIIGGYMMGWRRCEKDLDYLDKILSERLEALAVLNGKYSRKS